MHTTTKRQTVDLAQSLADAEQRVYVVFRFGDSRTGRVMVKPASWFETLDEITNRRFVVVVPPSRPGRRGSALDALREAFR